MNKITMQYTFTDPLSVYGDGSDQTKTVDVYQSSLPDQYGANFLYYSRDLSATYLSASNGWGVGNCRNFKP